MSKIMTKSELEAFQQRLEHLGSNLRISKFCTDVLRKNGLPSRLAMFQSNIPWFSASDAAMLIIAVGILDGITRHVDTMYFDKIKMPMSERVKKYSVICDFFDWFYGNYSYITELFSSRKIYNSQSHLAGALRAFEEFISILPNNPIVDMVFSNMEEGTPFCLLNYGSEHLYKIISLEEIEFTIEKLARDLEYIVPSTLVPSKSEQYGYLVPGDEKDNRSDSCKVDDDGHRQTDREHEHKDECPKWFKERPVPNPFAEVFKTKDDREKRLNALVDRITIMEDGTIALSDTVLRIAKP